MPQNEISCIQIVKLISAAVISEVFGGFAMFYSFVQEFQKEGPQFLITQSQHISLFYWYCNLGHFLLGNCVFEHVL